jgi:hypothetical protein
MSDHRMTSTFEPVHLMVDALPADVAREIREAQSRDPDLLRKILLYGITHKAVFETLDRAWRS